MDSAQKIEYFILIESVDFTRVLPSCLPVGKYCLLRHEMQSVHREGETVHYTMRMIKGRKRKTERE